MQETIRKDYLKDKLVSLLGPLKQESWIKVQELPEGDLVFVLNVFNGRTWVEVPEFIILNEQFQPTSSSGNGVYQIANSLYLPSWAYCNLGEMYILF